MADASAAAYVQLFMDKTVAADLSSGVFTVLVSVLRSVIAVPQIS